MIKQITAFLFISLFSLNAYSLPEDEAIKFVEKLQLGRNFYDMAYKTAQASQTYAMIVSEIGSREATKLLNTELNISIKKYQKQWDKNLALSYLEYFTPAELNSLAEEKDKSPYKYKMLNKQNDVGRAMEKKSQEIFVKVISEAVGIAFSKIPNK